MSAALAWLRERLKGWRTLIFGAADDAWVIIDDEIEASVLGAPAMDPQLVDVYLSPGQYPIRVRYAHRKATAAGFRFRVVGGDVSICYPEFPDPEEE